MGSNGRASRDTPSAPGHSALRGDVAIVGMACMYPRALGLGALWENVVSGTDAITDMPPERIPPSFYDPEAAGSDRTYCRRGGFLGPEVPFDPLQFGVMPVITESGEPEQFLVLQAAHDALRDAGFDPAHLDGERTEIIVGRGNYANRAWTIGQHHVGIVSQVVEILGKVRPDYTEAELAALRERLLARLPRFGPDNAAALVPNLTSARVANRFDCMGMNFTVDAACASALLALELGVRDLLSDKCDTALVGGAFIISDLIPLAVFTQLNALSRRGEIRPFDQQADGTLMGEGVGILVLKRLEDAEQDRDRIYAVVKGIGTASDGRALGLLAPRVEGQELALRRAYEMAGLDPSTVGLIEAHGTATPAGDAAEIESLRRVFGTRGPDESPRVALGTIKSMIGHTMPAAGAAGLIKAALALYHKVLPPSLHCETPNPDLATTPFYVNTATRPWIHGDRKDPRRAGVNAFGFGGANAHVILEEYRGGDERQQPSLLTRWPTEVFILEAPDRASLLGRAQQLATQLATADIELKDLAFTLNGARTGDPERLAIVAESLDDLRAKLDRAAARLADPSCSQVKDVRGIYYFAQPLARAGKLALVFPGEGGQYVGMLSDLCQHFPVVRQRLDGADNVSSMAYVFPPPWPEERARAEQRMWSTLSGAVEAVMAADYAVLALFQALELRPDAVVGHSGGDFMATFAAGVTSDEDVVWERLSELWHAYDAPPEDTAEAGLLAVGAGRDDAFAKLGDLADRLLVAMDNCPHQVVLAGPADAVDRARERLLASAVFCERLAFSRPYHTAAFAPQLGPLRQALKRMPVRPPAVPIYSCTTVDLYPSDVRGIRRLMIDHWARPVRFQETIRKMYADGVRIFLEVGPRGNLTAFIDDILRGQPYLAIGADNQRRHGVTQLQQVVALLIAHGVSLTLDELYARRSVRQLDLAALPTRQERRDPGKTLTLSVVQLQLDAAPDGPAGAPVEPAASAPGPHAAPPSDGQAEVVPAASAPTPRPDTAPAQPPRVGAPEPAGDIWQQSLPLPDGGPPISLPYVEAAPAMSEATLAPVGQGAVPDPAVSGPMLGYLRAMEQFLSVQQSVMQAFLSPGVPPEARYVGDGTLPAVESNGAPTDWPAPSTEFEALAPATPPEAVPLEEAAPHPAGLPAGEESDQYPLLGTLVAYAAGQELQAERILTLETDPFLFDHMLGKKVSARPELRPVGVVPATISMEIMAEAGAALLPGLRVVGLRQFRAFRWINVTERPTLLRISARQLAAEAGPRQIEVAIRAGELGSEPAESGPAAQGVVLLDADYPPAPPAEPFALEQARPCGTTVEQLYSYLFHGPRFHTIRAMHEVGQQGVKGEFLVLPLERFFNGRRGEAMILDPVVLDGAGQLLGGWVCDYVSNQEVMFPVQVDAVTFYGPRYGAGTVLPCNLRLRQFQHRQVQADMDVIGPDGRSHVRIDGWQDYRFHMPPNRIAISRDAKATFFGDPLDLAVAPLPAEGHYVARLIDGLGERGAGTMSDVWAYIMLTAAEREAWRALRGPAPRRAQWLMGRIAVKDALRDYLLRCYGLDLYPADLEVSADERGRPLVGGVFAAELPSLPAVSLAHTGLLAVAIVGGPSPDARLGIDLERIRPREPSFLAQAFTSQERAWLEALDEAARLEWLTRFWSAKEAVGKAVGHGLPEGPTGAPIQQVGWETGCIQLILHGELARRVPDLADRSVVAYTAVSGDLVVASTICQKVDQSL